MRKKHSPSEFKVDSTLSPANMYYADGQLIFNTAAVFAIWTGYLHLLLSFLTTKNVVATVESAKINPLKLVLVLTALLENCWVVSSACSPNSFIQPSVLIYLNCSHRRSFDGSAVGRHVQPSE